MAKSKTQFVCRECGALQPKWAGQCADCGGWNTFEEQAIAPALSPRQASHGYAGEAGQVVSLPEVTAQEVARIPTAMPELDRVLGGGLVPGSVVLIGGDPGIGKSTLLIQMLGALADSSPVLYVTGEESLEQVGLRASRLGLKQKSVTLMAQTVVESIIDQIRVSQPKVVVIDSIQTMFTQQLSSAPGSVGQVRESTAHLVRLAKQLGVALFLVGHVTKEGALAGPRVLEHMVDTVLYFESELGSRFRLVRAQKNRFGAANELGVFAMTGEGLKGVANPSAIFLAQHDKPVSGSSVMVTWEGSRPLMVEVQSLVDQAFGNPRRTAVGLEQNRLSMLLAVLHRHAGVALHDQDVFINAVGGVKVTETASDLAVCLAVMSSLLNRALPRDWIVFGEVGLAGEIRPVPYGMERLREAAKHGYVKAILPKANMHKELAGLGSMTLVPVASINDAAEFARDNW